MCIGAIVDFISLSRLKASTIEGIGPDMAAARARSLTALEEAAADIGDRLTHHSHQAAPTADFANSVYVYALTEIRSLVVWCGLILSLFIVVGSVAWLFPNHAEARVALQSFFYVVVAFCSFGGLGTMIMMAAQVEDGMNCKASVRDSLLRNASRIWSLGDKAVYSITQEEVQVIRIDAIGSVSLKGDDIVIRSRFGEPTASLPGGDIEKHALKELVADIKSRIE